MATAAILNHHPAASFSTAQKLPARTAAPMDASTNGTSASNNSDASSASISANDFLTLLVTEMQNQDPTATTDPNEYISQLVQVNSLEQLIGINQTLSGALGSSTSAAATNGAATRPSPAPSSSATAGGSPAPDSIAAENTGASKSLIQSTPGNLGIPAASPSADRIAHALDGQSLRPPLAGGILESH
jgi:flagellar basal-body rod modification protein FlgD